MKRQFYTSFLTYTLLLYFFTPVSGVAQIQQNFSVSEIKEQIAALGTAGSVLYVAAHPDDENTRLISYFSNKKHYRTSYLALTRGDGGQNLIGPEIRELLGIIRTQELLAARRVDGGYQYFSRANDFGYSKNPTETLHIWDKQKVLADVVWVMRKTRPDIIINRFNANSAGETHGHHTASAMLSVEAFNLAGDSNAFPEQLKYVDVWQPKRIFFNTSWWFYGSKEKFAEADKSNMTTINIGSYLPILGESNTEISARSRSMHKSQGFGRMGRRGDRLSYIELINGPNVKNNDPMSGINTSLSRIDPSGKLEEAYKQFKSEFNIYQPKKSIDNLLAIIDILNNLEASYWQKIKLNQAHKLLKNISGLYIMAAAEYASYTPGDSIEINIELIARNTDNVNLQSIVYQGNIIYNIKQNLKQNIDWKHSFDLKVPENIEYTSPYWLREPWTIGMYTVKDQQMRGKAENGPALYVDIKVAYDGKAVNYQWPVIFHSPDQVKGEIKQPLAIVPAVTMNIEQPVYVFSNNDSKPVSILLKSWKDDVQGRLEVSLPDGWTVKGVPAAIKLNDKGSEKRILLHLNPPAQAAEGKLKVSFVTDEGRFHKRMDIIDYPHIPNQYVLRNSESKIVKLDLKTAGNLIGYIEGAGDQIPFALKQMGYKVHNLTDAEILGDKLSQYDAIVTGVRAYNTNPRIKVYQPHLLKYVRNGGTLIVQYNKTRSLNIDNIGPYPITLSHERVTEEHAEVRFLQPESPILNYPNKITSKDFEGWVQERGLYFATKWDKHYTPILAAHDKGEPDRKGGMLLARYGKGYYVYTGYSWFRELPAGVSGAYRIFANLVSLGNKEIEQ